MDERWFCLEACTSRRCRSICLELDVFSFNPSAEKAYQSAGFKREGVLRDAIWNGKEFADDILMAILEDEWKQIKVNS